MNDFIKLKQHCLVFLILKMAVSKSFLACSRLKGQTCSEMLLGRQPKCFSVSFQGRVPGWNP